MQPELVTYEHGLTRAWPAWNAISARAPRGSSSQALRYVSIVRGGVQQISAPRADAIKNLRPAQETCEQCHWPRKFVGNLDKTYNYFLGDETNTPFSMRLIIKVGGGDPTHGPVGGIHCI